jgi:hypothetical protein
LEYVPERGRVTEPVFGVILNWIAFKKSVWLAFRLSWLIKGVGPPFWLRIVIVVSSASVAPARPALNPRSIAAKRSRHGFMFSLRLAKATSESRKKFAWPRISKQFEILLLGKVDRSV